MFESAMPSVKPQPLQFLGAVQFAATQVCASV